MGTIISPVLAKTLSDKQVVTITFGSPRVGDAAFVRWFDTKVHQSYRIVNGNDAVTMTPPGRSYLHVHSLMQIGNANGVSIRTDEGRGRYRSLISGSIKSHELDGYISSLTHLNSICGN